MNIDVTEDEYLETVSEVCRIVDELLSIPQGQLRIQDASLKRFIAAIYDTVVPCDVLETLMCSDGSRRERLLVLLVGRCKYGRPKHTRADDMLAWGHECLSEHRQR